MINNYGSTSRENLRLTCGKAIKYTIEVKSRREAATFLRFLITRFLHR